MCLMLTALTHEPSANLANCELTFVKQEKISNFKAQKQHLAYCEKLRNLGVNVITLLENAHLPDSVFVEDTAIVLDEIAIITAMGAKSREQEIDLISNKLSEFRPLAQIDSPATIEGGDILKIGKKIFVGHSTRTNKSGIKALGKIVADYDYEVIEVKVTGCLHLKTACATLDDSTVLINSDWVDRNVFNEFEQIEVPTEEPFAANILRVGETICMHEGFEKTKRIVENRAYQVETIDISEFLKAEAGLTCMSIIFEAD